MTPMRIALLCHKYWPAVGGLCTYTGRLVEYLVERGHRVDIFTTQTPADTPEFERIGPSSAIRRFKPRSRNHLPFYIMPGLVAHAVSREFGEADVVHSVGYYFFPSVFGQAASWIRGKPHVCTPVFALNPATWEREVFDKTMGRRLVRNASHVIVQSDHERRLMHEHRFTLPRQSVVPFGVDSWIFDCNYDVSDLRTRHAISESEQVLLFVGKIMSPKGAFDCLEAVARLRAAGRRVRLIMIGDVHARERTRFKDDVERLALGESVILTGPLTDRVEIARYYQLADAVVFPSQYEQFGIVAIEAGASGKPLLSTPVGIMQTLVPRYENGLLHPFGDLDRFTQNLIDVLDTPRFRNNAARHRAEFLTTYSWREIARQTENIYADVVRENSAN